MNKFRIVLKSIFLASTFVINAFAEDKDTAFVPFTVNVDAVATARLDGVDKFEKQVRAGYIDTLHIITEGDPLLARPGKMPNPVIMHSSRGRISLELSQQLYRSADIALYSLNGKQVLRGSGEHPNLAMGVYLLSVRGVNGSAFTARFVHSGGGLNIDVGFGNGNSGSLLEKAISGNWTITVSAEGYLDTLYAFFPETGWGSTPVQEISLRQILVSSSSSSVEIVSSSSSSETSSSSSSVPVVFKTIVIGTQIWMAENLNYNATGSKCYGDNTGGDSQGNCVKYGRLYDWATARGVCPAGWHLPSDVEWTTLTYHGGGAGTKLKATTGWNTGSNYIPGTDEYGFSALPGGYGTSDGRFYDVGDYGHWWSSTESDSYYAYFWFMHYKYSDVFWNNCDKSYLFSVRCLKDD